MPKFIKVTGLYGGVSYHINVDKIEVVVRQDESGRIVINGGSDSFSHYDVKETVEEIMEMING